MAAFRTFFTARRADRPHRSDDLHDRFRHNVLPHLDAAYQYACHIARDPVLAEDIVQDAFLKAFARFTQFRGGDARAWLLAIVRNCFFDWARTNRRNVHYLVPFDTEDRATDQLPDLETEGPEDAMIRRSEEQAVRTALQQLPEPFREALVLREYQDLSYQEISVVTGAPIGTVMSRLARARRILATSLDVAPERKEAGQ